MATTTEPKTFDEIRTAYADAGPQLDNSAYLRSMRCLSFLTSQWLSPEQAKEAVHFIGEYNRYTPATVEMLIDEAVDVDEDILFAIGGEGSPAVYAETDTPEGVLRAFGGEGDPDPFDTVAMRNGPDELSLVEPEKVGQARVPLYGDGEDQMPAHEMCNHDEPPVAVEDYAETRDDKSYVRAWWD